jgi:putative phosphoesterase
MRIAALYDIHGNLPALEAVMAEVKAARVERIVIGGDVIPGPMPRECLDAVFAIGVPTHFIIGNGDRESLAAKRGTMSNMIPPAFRPAMDWNGAQLTVEDERAIDAWPLTERTHVDGIGDVVFCHATPRNDVEIFVSTTAEEKLLPIFDPLHAAVVVCGHTHMQFDRHIGSTRVINAGSVGMPFQKPGAYWLLIGPGIELRRTGYDLPRAADRVRATAYPLGDDFAAKILNGADEAETAAKFAAAELK